jgi:peptide-methionine (R)-S-oxide reductase
MEVGMSDDQRNAQANEAEWRQKLSDEEYRILREKGTERAFSGKYWNHMGQGTYACAGCGEPLFESGSKFNSGSGWPSFYQAKASEAIAEETDTSHGMVRTEVMCAKCGGHLGHLFNDAPATPTGMRYCINSASLKFKDKQGE